MTENAPGEFEDFQGAAALPQQTALPHRKHKLAKAVLLQVFGPGVQSPFYSFCNEHAYQRRGPYPTIEFQMSLTAMYLRCHCLYEWAKGGGTLRETYSIIFPSVYTNDLKARKSDPKKHMKTGPNLAGT